MSDKNTALYDIAIIGAGPAGLSAAIYAERAGYNTICFEGNVHGGQIINTPEVENYPALGKVSGVEYAMNLYEQAVGFGARIEYTAVLEADLRSTPKKIVTASGVTFAKTVIIANGVQRRTLGCPGEDKFLGKGVSYCAVCDGSFFKGKEVAVIGGGNTALEDAVYLASLCEKVHLVHRRDTFRGAPHEVAKVLANDKIQIWYNHVPAEIAGDTKVEEVVLQNVETQEMTNLPVSAVFVSVGMIPQNDIFSKTISLTKEGYIQTGEDCKTKIEGVFAAGDTRHKHLRQLVTAAADGAIAATSAAAYLSEIDTL